MGNTFIPFLVESWMKRPVPFSCLHAKYNQQPLRVIEHEYWNKEETASLVLSKAN